MNFLSANLIGHEGGKDRELSAAIIDRADTRTLRDIAASTRKTIKEERAGRVTNPVGRWILRVVQRMPGPAFRRTLDLFDRSMQQPHIAEQIYREMPFTTGITNVGATLADQEGILFRGGAICLPQRMLHIGTLWAISAVQDEVIPVDGRPEVRPMLPVILVFDHRLIDGVRASRLILRFREIIGAPEDVFGADGRG